MASRGLSVEEIMAIMPETPGRITALTEGMTADELHRAPEPGSWSVSDVLAHLRACHDVLGGNVLRIITEDHPSWKGMNPRTWQRKTDYHEWEFGPALGAFARQRAELLAVLEALLPEGWERTATVSVPPAKTFEYTARYYGDWMAGHERAHLKKLPRTIAAVKGPAWHQTGVVSLWSESGGSASGGSASGGSGSSSQSCHSTSG